jgi:hypothetical protein
VALKLGLDVPQQLARWLGSMGADAPLVGLEQLTQERIVHGFVLLWVRIDHWNARAGVAPPVQYAPQAPHKELVRIVFTALPQLDEHMPEIALWQCGAAVCLANADAHLSLQVS